MKKARKSGWSVPSFLVSEGLRSLSKDNLVAVQRMASETSETTLKSGGGGGGGGQGEKQNRSERETPLSLSPFLPRTLFDACHEGCKNAVLRWLRIQ